MKSLKALHYALALYEARSFTAAARSLGISQSALSRAIQKLEKDLRVSLFDRSRSAVKPTPFGEAYLGRADDILRQLEDAEREVRMMSGLEKGTLRVGFGPVYSASLAGPAVGSFVMENPNLEVRITLGGWPYLFKTLLTDEIDLYVGEISVLAQYAGLKTIPLSTQSGVFFCRPGHPLLEQDSVTVEDLAQYPFASVQLPPRIQGFLKEIVSLDKTAGGVEIARPPIECDDFFVTKRVVFNSQAVGLASSYVLRDELEAGTLQELKVTGNRLSSQGGVVAKDQTTLSPSAQEFISHLLDCDRNYAPARPASEPREQGPQSP
ncbi:MAG: LysR family transcriptional regulator [Desulfarculaceae bacterium]|nr:LysR family transcriptional regulator [Desulfarculaceae bacterium]MCF8071508.1 LysR family transcriptional regulator [Desulfarculaceae bacterium]MCF8102323.1 LysR family transcriptional regulator [Desulfarculaceae bacterium]MCF8114787.1 LysR family transcriptional regulator [Desulfarculaceae bacterium]